LDRLLDDRYRLGPVVGRGGMATVHAATDTLLRRAVAVKLFTPPDEVALARLSAEARLLAGLSHPGLLRVFDMSTAAGRPYLVMQLVSGVTLRTVINRGPVPAAFAARLGVRLAETLHYVHSQGVVHRDIKPSNVLLDDDSCYLADFGIAKALGAARITASGHCVGTAAYLAPEQVSGLEAGPPADIYALGLVLLECLTGRPEYTGSEAEAAVARLNRPPHVPDGLPIALGAALTAMTARDPDDRPDAAACAALLGSPRTPTKLLETARPRPRRLVRAALSAAVLAGLAAGTLTLLNDAVPGSSRPTPPAEGPNAVPAVTLAPRTAETTVAPVPPGPQVPPAHGAEKPAKKKGGKGRG
jgi:eukaryotic-like serine/threonine-protein kinase